MLGKLFKKAKLEIFTPVNGVIVPIEEVPDPVFSQKMMGEGIAIIPSQGNVVSPVEGEIIQIAPTKHAVGILAKDGTEILIHVGLETVALKGEGFTVHVEVGEKVSAGQLLMNVDLEYIQTHAKSIITPIVITNSQTSDKSLTFTREKEAVAGQTVVISASQK
ncbi:PTS sugar transporter subunit IIA [Bacillus massiliigorillae]|uniref:PTS sugar transporter subunit IIA n=1 Tax=Bacillus massiliigorillae TaxID=1243664 RepID=UPI0003A47396|nr:PTS glucose transporter subunit IIA [Bacillus massiliigorillae]